MLALGMLASRAAVLAQRLRRRSGCGGVVAHAPRNLSLYLIILSSCAKNIDASFYRQIELKRRVTTCWDALPMEPSYLKDIYTNARML
jgi:hypothetical protein